MVDQPHVIEPAIPGYACQDRTLGGIGKRRPEEVVIVRHAGQLGRGSGGADGGNAERPRYILRDGQRGRAGVGADYRMDSVDLHKTQRHIRGNPWISGSVRDDTLNRHAEHTSAFIDMQYGELKGPLSVGGRLRRPGEVEQQAELQ